MKHPSKQPAMGIVISMFCIVLVTLSVPSCTYNRTIRNLSTQTTLNRYTYARILMGSRCTITLYARSEPQAALAAGEAFDEIARIEHILTDYDPNSESMRVTQAHHNQWHPISQTLLDVLLESKKFYRLSRGAFDPTVGPYTHLWRKVTNQGRIPTRSELELVGESTGFEYLEIDPQSLRIRTRVPGMILDFGGIGKGYAADRAIEMLSSLGYPRAMVNLGGDLAIGDPPQDHTQGWAIEIQTGINAHKRVNLANCGIATSGDLERFFLHNGVRYSHILDPRTGIGLTEQRAATVIASNCTTADALASAVSVLGHDGLASIRQSYPDARIELITIETNAEE